MDESECVCDVLMPVIMGENQSAAEGAAPLRAGGLILKPLND